MTTAIQSSSSPSELIKPLTSPPPSSFNGCEPLWSPRLPGLEAERRSETWRRRRQQTQSHRLHLNASRPGHRAHLLLHTFLLDLHAAPELLKTHHSLS